MEYLKNHQLQDCNSFKTKALAKLFCAPTNVDELICCLKEFRNEEKLIIGGGCNLFFTQDYDGLVIKPSLRGIKEIYRDNDVVRYEVMASEDWDSFVAFCVSNNLSGLENLSLIPGSVGASPVQNIGAYGAEAKDCIHEVSALNIDTCQLKTFSNEECGFAYRDSIFKQTGKYIIVSVVYELKRTFSYRPKYADLNKALESNAAPTIEDVRQAVIKIREQKLPNEKELPNCGSFFKNPYITVALTDKIKEEYDNLPIYPHKEGWVKTSAAFLIDRAGFKGVRDGNIGTYPNQALIIVNYGATDGNEIIRFMQSIQQAVKEKFSIQLEPEVRIF